MTAQASTSTGLLYQVENNIKTGDFVSAQTYNTSVTPTNNADDASKQVNSIYINYLLTDSISPADSAVLNTFAYSDALIYGDAVYSARVLLRIDPSDGGVSLRAMKPAEVASTSDDNKISIYPNPTTGMVNVVVDSMDSYDLKVVDLSSKLFCSKSISTQQYTLDLSALENGMYFIVVSNNNSGYLRKEKLIIVK